ncbi:MAG TPA: esterase/lipase family protein, partial [Candidatus Avalokitesvara rifleensis]|uniref:esterase/lipase family protein n=1 Tax=Candidatus Avalokitesvara rifleensis TaxID=3367620 RepID=UPI004029FECE
GLGGIHIHLKRPPVILVAGVWGSGKPKLDTGKDNPNYTWSKFLSMLVSKGYSSDDIIDVNYDKKFKGINLNAASFDHPEIRKILENSIKKALDDLHGKKVAGRKVDIVAHSMGGLVVRSFCATNPNLCKDHIRKLITIDTPHLGSELADLIELVQKGPSTAGPYVSNQMHTLFLETSSSGRSCLQDTVKELNSLGYSTTQGAIEGMTTHSHALNLIPRFYELKLPTHAIIGLTSSVMLGVHKDIQSLWLKLNLECGVSPSSSFIGRPVFIEPNDRIVSQSSQAGELSIQAQSDFGPPLSVDHLTVLKDNTVVSKVLELLEVSPSKERFEWPAEARPPP